MFLMKKVLVSDIMTREPITVDKDTSLLECAKKMVGKHVKSLPIVENSRLVGFISQRDILWALTKKSPEDLMSIKSIDISPKKVETIKPSASIDEALKKMKNSRFEKLPVIQDNELVGVITIKDILNFHPEIYPELEEFAMIREEGEKLKRVQKAVPVDDSENEGICGECGEQDFLQKVNGMFICESCKNSV
jgi:CBS domain-containing protein